MAPATVVVNHKKAQHLQANKQKNKYLRKAEKHQAAAVAMVVAAAVDVNL